MIRDAKQRAAVCDRLVSPLHRKGIRWTEQGCTVKSGAQSLGLSHQEAVLYEASWAFWNGANDKPSLEDCIFVLSGEWQHLVGSLLVACSEGTEGLDSWIAAHPVKSPPHLHGVGGRHG